MNLTHSSLDLSNKRKNVENFKVRNYFNKFKQYLGSTVQRLFKSKKHYVQEPEIIISTNNNKKIKSKNSRLTWLLHSSFFFISYILYFLSLKGCYEGEDVCTLDELWMISRVTELIISVIINVVMFSLIIYNKVSALNLIHFILIFIFFYKYSHETLFEDHGYYNFVCFFSLLWIFILLELIVHGIIVFVKSKYRYFIVLVIFTIIIFIIIIYKIDPLNCDEWPYGLNNTYLENGINKYGCQIKYPKICSYKIFGDSQDITKITKLDCTVGKKDARKTLLDALTSPFINSNTKKFGYPLTNKGEVGGLDGKDKWVLLNYTYENMLDMDNITREIKYWPEQVVDFTQNENGELRVNLNFNETLSKERKKLENKLIPYANNIMILYVDSVARTLAMRQLKKTMKFFEKFMPYQGGHHDKYPEENYHSFQFFKYHSFRMFTSGNYPQLFYGTTKEANDFVLITRYLKENGYVTNYCSDECKKDNTRTHHNMTQSEIYDHQMLLCDPNLTLMNKPIKKCFYGNINSYHLYEYGKQFWTKYKDNRKFSALVTNDGHESTLEVLKYTDDIIYNYLTSLYEQNLLKDTTVLMVSDHGTLLPSIYFLNDFYQIEGRLPMLFMLVNDRKNISYYEQYYHIQQNQQTFITAYDFYNTIGHLLYGDKYNDIENKTNEHDTPKSPLGESLFNYIDQMKRNPKNYQNMDTHICK